MKRRRSFAVYARYWRSPAGWLLGAGLALFCLWEFLKLLYSARR